MQQNDLDHGRAGRPTPDSGTRAVVSVDGVGGGRRVDDS
jgi:hypothetical protein